ncbi:hypothetical protein CASFOL_018818 [Castilleja foliolosa]|uniref:Uncharacterized protein n=1 Tax=Castilleja foliolosa TaxID=1961234 RepID=A0ABD3D5N2_9LAMI
MSGRDGEDSQKLKRIGAGAYDYDNDSRWPDYWSNVLIPPHMASRNDVVDHLFYQRYIDPDLIVEPMANNNSSKPERASTPPPQSSSSAIGNSNTRQRSSGKLVMNGVESNGNVFSAPIGYGMIAPFSGTTATMETAVPMYGSAGTFPGKAGAMKCDSGGGEYDEETASQR